MKKLLREPLLHFLLMGAALFAVYALVSQSESAAKSDRRIVVHEGRVRQLMAVFERTWQRPPTEEELQRSVDDFVLEEIYYRQAVAMGIDRDDTIIRRRLRQKLEFLTEDMATLGDPSEDELQAFLTEHAEAFREPSSYSFRQVYINPEKHGEHPQEFAAALLQSVRSGEDVPGDSSLLPQRFTEETSRNVDARFGVGFAHTLDGLQLERWEGPVSSGLGLHLILLESRIAGSVPELSEVRSVVQREWANAKRVTMRQQVDDRVRSEYDVVIDWPQELGNVGQEDDS